MRMQDCEMNLEGFDSPEALKDWIEEQDDPEDLVEELMDLVQGGELQGMPAQYMVYGALSLLDEFPMSGAVQPATLEKKWDVLDEDGERTYGDDDYNAQAAICEDVKTAFNDMTGAVAGGPDKEGDTDLEFDDEGRISGMEDWWINDDKEGRWMVVVDEWPYFNFVRQI